MSEPAVEITEAAEDGDDIAFVKTLFVEYAESLGFSLCFQGFDGELQNLPGMYTRPEGNLWLARVDGALAGCVAMRPHQDAAAEMKRLYVRPGFRGHRLGNRLTTTVIHYARAQGYSALRLDTVVDKMREAQAIYRQLGFEKRAPYYDDAPVDLVFYERDLTLPV
ncbi:MAG: GNAT family N-acetyltransferase [Alphaproteobacteria bacterium]|nr:GNAT family N-acetyltransferase [Alphaproteobacteria bacterium]